jgi:uncharacterized protein (TIGR02646 family)
LFDEYGHAKPHLIGRMGDYCSFCELPLAAALAVEHIRCKDKNPTLEREWDNFLLACPSCNSSKGVAVDTVADVERHLWPHQERSADAFIYSDGGIVRVAEDLPPVTRTRAAATESLVGLGRRPGAGLTRDQILRGSDRRYEKRRAAWDQAVNARNDLRRRDDPETRKWILVSACALGFWSVWMTVFADDAAMQAALCDLFPGTARDRIYPLPQQLRRRDDSTSAAGGPLEACCAVSSGPALSSAEVEGTSASLTTVDIAPST